MFNQINPNELWLAFGMGSHFLYIPPPPVHEVVSGMDPRNCAIQCVSSFSGRGRKTAWKIWQVFSGVTEALKHFLLMEDDSSDSVISKLEHLQCLCMTELVIK